MGELCNAIVTCSTYSYDNLGNRTSVTFANGASQSFGYDPVSRLASLTNDLPGTTNDFSAAFTYSPASQIATSTRAGDAYAFTGHANQNVTGVANGLNQLTSVGGTSATYEARGNLTTDPITGKTYGYSSENLLTTGFGSVTASYDPMLRLYQVAGAATTRGSILRLRDHGDSARDLLPQTPGPLKRCVWQPPPRPRCYVSEVRSKRGLSLSIFLRVRRR